MATQQQSTEPIQQGQQPQQSSTKPTAQQTVAVGVEGEAQDDVDAKFTGMLGLNDGMPVEEVFGKEVSTSELFRFAKGYDRVLLICGIINGIFLGAALPMFSFLFGKLVNSAAGEDQSEVAENVSGWAKWMLLAAACAWITGTGNMGCFITLGERQVAVIRELYFESVLNQEPGWFDVQRSGALTSRLHGDTQLIHKGLGEKAALFWMHTSTLLCSYIVGFISSWRLTLVLLATSPILGVAGAIMGWALLNGAKKSRESYEKASALVEDTLSGMRTVHAFSAHTAKMLEFNTHIEEARLVTQWLGWQQGLGMGFVMFVFFGTYAIGFYYASYLIDWGIHDIGEILACFFSVVIGSFSMGQIGPPVAAFGEAKAAAFRVFAVIDRKPRVMPGKARLEKLEGEIVFKDMQFRYPMRMDNPVFTKLNLKVAAGSSVGLVGLSGCGKSSLVSLVQRFYEPTAGYFARVVDKGAVEDDGTGTQIKNEKAYPYESNLQLLEGMEAGAGKVTVVLPVTAEGTKVKSVEVDLEGMTHRVVDGDGAVRCENGVWYWVEEELDAKTREARVAAEKFDFEFRLPQDVSNRLNAARGRGERKVVVELAVGAFEVDVQALTRTAVVSGVTFAASGALLVDGVPLGDIDVDWWREQIGVVTQEPVLFVGTVLENVRHGRPSATLEEVVEACKAANIHHVIERWPEQYETRVGEGGCQLSGGQKQRIAIARAIIKRPKILVLDEATSALDRASELEVQRALDKLLKGSAGGHKPTTFIIAHRLQTVMGADQIVVMKAPETREAGAKIVEQGTHKELVGKNGVYANLWNSQNRGKTVIDHEDEASAADADDAAAAEDDAAPLVMMETAEEQAKKKEEAKKEKIKQKSSLSRVAALAKPEAAWMIPGLLGSMMNGVVYPAYAYIFTKALDVFAELQSRDDCDELSAANATLCTSAQAVCEVLQEANRTACELSNDALFTRSDVDIWAAGFALIGLWAWLANVLQFGAFGYMGEMLTERIRTMLFKHILRQDMGFFDQPEHEVGALSSMLSKEAQQVNQLFGPAIGMLLRTIFCLGTGFGIAFYFSWKLSLVLLATVPCLILSGAINILLVSGADVSGATVAGRVTTEAITNIKTVVAFSMKEHMIETYREAGAAELSMKTKRAIGLGITFGFNQFAMFATFALGLWYGGKLISDGEEEFQDIMIVIMEITMSAMGVGETTAMQGAGMDADEAAATIFTILDTEPAVDQQSDEGHTGLKTNKIEFKNVTFAYPTRPNIDVLKQFNLTIDGPENASMQTGLIGGTGSGKSTVIQLLERFYALPGEKGQVLVDGHDLAGLNLQYWRSQVGLVSQEPTLFQGTVLENIRVGKPDATMEEVVAAAKLAHIHDTIEKLPAAYDTYVGTKGSMLSGGQKQRVAIARAIVKQPRFLLLDEATSALDNESEREVQVALDNVIAQGRMTTIAIAHRLTTIRNADSITVLDRGVITEQGTHDELMQIENGDYRTRYELYHSLDEALTVAPSGTQSPRSSVVASVKTTFTATPMASPEASPRR